MKAVLRPGLTLATALAFLLIGSATQPAHAQLGFLRKMMEDPTKIGSYLDPTRPENYPSFPGGSGSSDSQIQVITDPSIGPDGRVFGGSSSGGGAGDFLGYAQLVHEANGQAFFVHGGMRRRAPQFDRAPVPQFQPQPPPPPVDQPPPAPPQPGPVGLLRFHYPEANGSPAVFVELGNGQWINHANGQRYQFQQVARNDQQVILRDFSRNLTVMLNANGTKFWTINGQWNGLGQGLGQWLR